MKKANVAAKVEAARRRRKLTEQGRRRERRFATLKTIVSREELGGVPALLARDPGLRIEKITIEIGRKGGRRKS